MLNQRDPSGQTALMLACRAGSADCVRLLLAAGADATLAAGCRSCLHIAAQQGAVDVIDALLGNQSWVMARAARGRRCRILLRNALLTCRDGHYKVGWA